MFKAVIFDIGGVVMQSPFIAISEYERKLGIPVNYINCAIAGRGPQGAWAKFERGEIGLLQFYKNFGMELSDSNHGNRCYIQYCRRRGESCPMLPENLTIDGRELFGAMMQAASQYDRHVRHALLKLRDTGKHKLIALTNNFANIDVPLEEATFLGWTDGPTPNHLRDMFDDFCDSSSLGMRKPEAGFYLLACERNGITPTEAIFLDDIGSNLKAAKALGMETIQVKIGKSLDAVKELEQKLGLDLRGPLMISRL